MRKIVISVLAGIALFVATMVPAHAQYYDRKDRFQVGAMFPGILFGNKNIDAMLSGAFEGEYFILENLSLGFRLQESTDFKMGDAPHNVFSFGAIVRYTFDVAEDWAVYYGVGGGGALIGSSSWAGDFIPVNFGGYYQFDDHLSFGVDSGMHVFVRSNTAVAFWIGPMVRWKF